MNELQTYMKKLNVLYVEDEKPAREMFSRILNRQFTNITICENGLDGYLSYKENSDKNTKFDLIISDINMPKMSGIELVEKIREEDNETLVILVTARSEASVIMKALELQVSNYITKPIDLSKTSEVIISTCEKIYLKSQLHEKQMELETYTKTIEDVALVLKIDAEDTITYINDVFCSTTGYLRDEIIGKSSNFLFTQRNEKQLSDMWNILKEGNTFKDTIKSTTKNNEIYYSKITIVPVLDNNNSMIVEYIFIGFITTDEEKKKQELNKKLLHNIADSKKEKFNILKEKDAYEENISLLNKTILNTEERYDSLLKTNQSLLVQLEAYETNSLGTSDNHIKILKSKNEEIAKLQKNLVIMKNDKSSLSNKLNTLEETLASKNHNIEFLEKNHKVDRLKIENLERIILDSEKDPDKKTKTFF